MNPFRLLKLDRDCSDDDVRIAYEKHCAETQNDKRPQADEAFEMLKSAEARKEYLKKHDLLIRIVEEYFEDCRPRMRAQL